LVKKAILIVAILVVVAVFVPAVSAAGGYGSDWSRGGGVAARDGSGRGFGLCADLDLTEQQQAQMAELREQFRAGTADLRDELAAVREELREMRREMRQEPGADSTELQAKFQEMAEVRAALREQAEAHRAAVESILTPEQLERLGDMSFGPRVGWSERGHGPDGGRCRGSGSGGPACGGGD